MNKLVTLHARHPLWSFVRMGVLGLATLGMMYVRATSFGHGEVAVAGLVAVVSVVFDMLKYAFTEHG